MGYCTYGTRVPYRDNNLHHTSWCLCLNRQSTYSNLQYHLCCLFTHFKIFNFHVCDMIRTGIALVLMLHFYRIRVCYCKKVNLVPGIVLPWHRTPREKDCSYTYSTGYIILVRKLLIIDFLRLIALLKKRVIIIRVDFVCKKVI